MHTINLLYISGILTEHLDSVINWNITQWGRYLKDPVIETRTQYQERLNWKTAETKKWNGAEIIILERELPISSK